MDTVQLGYEIRTAQVKQAAADLNRMRQAGVSAADNARDLGLAERQLAASQATANVATNRLTGSLGLMNNALRSNQTRMVGLQLSQLSQQAMAGGGFIRALAMQLPDIGLAFGSIGIAAGVLGGLLLPMAANFLGVADAGEAMEKRLEAVTDALSAQAAASEKAALSNEQLRAQYGAFAETMRSTLDLLSQVAANEAKRQIDGLAQSLTDLYGVAGDGDSRAALAKFFDLPLVLAFTKQTRELRDTTRSLAYEFQQAQSALVSANGDIDAQIEATRTLLATAAEMAELKDGISESEAELLKSLSDTLDVMIQQKEALVSQTEAQVAVADSVANTYAGYLATREEAERANATAQEMLTTFNNQAEVLTAIVRYGRDSAEVAAIRRDQEYEIFNATLDTLQVTEQMKNELRSAFIENQNLTAQAAATADNLASASSQAAALAQNLAAAANALSAVMNATANMNISAIGLEAQNKALAKGNDLIDARKAGLIAVKRAELATAFGAEDAIVREAAAVELENYTEAVNRNSAAQRENDKFTKALAASTKASTKAAKAGGAAKKGGAAASKAAAAAEKAYNNEVENGIALTERYMTPFEKYLDGMVELEDVLGQGHISAETYNRAVADLNNELGRSNPLVNDLADAWAAWLGRGFRDAETMFKSVLGSFKRMIVDMIATAARNKIMLSIGMGGLGTLGGLGGIAQAGLGLLGGGGGAVAGGAGIAGAVNAFGSSVAGGLGAVGTGLMSGGLGGAVSAVGSGISGGLAAGGISGLGTALGAAIPVIGAVVGAIGLFKSKTKELDNGIRLTIQGNNLLAESYRKTEKSRLLGLSKKRKTSYTELQNDPLTEAYSAIHREAKLAANALGLSQKALHDYSTQIDITTKGMDDAAAQEAILGALAEVQNELAGAFFTTLGAGSKKMMEQGEDMSTAMSRITASVGFTKTALKQLGYQANLLGISGANAANSFVKALGGFENAAGAISDYVDGFYTVEEKAELARRNVLRTVGRMFENIPKSVASYKRAVDVALASGNTNRASKLISLAPVFEEWLALRDQMQTDVADQKEAVRALREARAEEQQGLLLQIWEATGDIAKVRAYELAQLDPLNRKYKEMLYRLEDQAAALAIANQEAETQSNLQQQINQLTGNTNAIRAKELEGLSSASQALQRRIYALQDAAAAEAAAAAIAEQRLGLEGRINALTGNTAAIRAAELATLDPSNRALLERIFALEDEADELERMTAIGNERLGIQRQIWQLLEDEDAIRADVLAGLDESNRALQEQYYALVDQKNAQEELAKAADEAQRAIQALIDAVDPNTFSTLFDFQKALGEAAQGLDKPQQVVPTGLTLDPANTNTSPYADEVKGLRAELKTYHEESRALMMNSNTDVRRLRLNSDRNQEVGLPPTRSVL